MTLPKAIELLQMDLDDPGCIDIMDLNKAQALGIQALEEVKYYRNNPVSYVLKLLLGETKET